MWVVSSSLSHEVSSTAVSLPALGETQSPEEHRVKRQSKQPQSLTAEPFHTKSEVEQRGERCRGANRRIIVDDDASVEI